MQSLIILKNKKEFFIKFTLSDYLKLCALFKFFNINKEEIFNLSHNDIKKLLS